MKEKDGTVTSGAFRVFQRSVPGNDVVLGRVQFRILAMDSVGCADWSDATLVVGISRWRDDALGEIYRRHGGAVFGLARRILGDRARAEDVVQDVFVRLWEAPERFEPSRASLRSWLLIQTHSRSVDVLRSDSARRQREGHDAGCQADPASDVDGELVAFQLSEQVRAALDELPRREREPIELAYFAGRSYREVAALLGEPEGTIKSRIRTGLHRLRAELARRGVEPSWQTT